MDGSSTLITVTAENTPQKGIIEITKTGEVLKSVTENEDGTYTPVFGDGNLAGAVFEIRAAEDILTPDGTKRFDKGEVVDTVTTDADGKAVCKALYLGKYVVTETTAPVNHVLNTETYTTELTYAGQNVELTSDSLSIDNERQKAEVGLVKSMETDELYGYGKDRHKDIVFGIFAETEIIAQDGTSIPADGMVEAIGVTEDGNSYSGSFTADLPHGEYYVQETAVSEVYILDDTKYPVDFTYKDQDTAVVNIAVNNGDTIENIIIRGNIKGKKTDENGNALSGALMGLFAEDETEFTEETALQTDTSGLLGGFKFKDVPYGRYIVREIKAPDGFALNETSYEVTIDEDGEEIKISVVNEITKFDIAKTDITTGEPVIGAKLSIIPVDEDGKPDVGATFATWITREKEHRVEGLEPGKTYVLRERLTGMARDAGYVTAQDLYFTVEDTGEVQKVEMRDDYTKLEILKIDADTGEALHGAKLQLCDEKGDEVAAWVSDETPYYLERIPVGQYILKELQAPEGYALFAPFKIHIEDTKQLQSFVLKNKREFTSNVPPLPDKKPEPPEPVPLSESVLPVKPVPQTIPVVQKIIQPKRALETKIQKTKRIEKKILPRAPETRDENWLLLWFSVAAVGISGFIAATRRKK